MPASIARGLAAAAALVAQVAGHGVMVLPLPRGGAATTESQGIKVRSITSIFRAQGETAAAASCLPSCDAGEAVL